MPAVAILRLFAKLFLAFGSRAIKGDVKKCGLGNWIKNRYNKDCLPKPVHFVVRACWKIIGKPIQKLSLGLLARWQGFATPANWEWKINLLLGLHEEGTVKLCGRLIQPGTCGFENDASEKSLSRSRATVFCLKTGVTGLDEHATHDWPD